MMATSFTPLLPFPCPDMTVTFLAGVALEEAGDTDGAERVYCEILSLSEHSASAINLGTILYRRGDFAEAEALYRRATMADPTSALAFFDLGNTLDELQRCEEAIEAYQTAIQLCPTYADCRYNLALEYERSGEPRRALRHWAAYLRADPSGPWADHARRMIRRTLDREKLAIVWRRGVCQ